MHVHDKYLVTPMYISRLVSNLFDIILLVASYNVNDFQHTIWT